MTAGMLEALGTAISVLPAGRHRKELQVVRRLGALSPRTAEWSRFSVRADLPLSEAARTAAPVVVASQEERNRRYRLLADMPSTVDHSLICLPLQVEGRAIGGVALGYPDVRAISPDNTRLAMTLAGQAAQAVERARLYEAELDARRQAENARERLSFLELCKTPEAAAAVTLQPVDRLGVDAAILFADILLILEPLGFALEFAKGEGPVIHNPVRTAADVGRVRRLEDPEPLGYVTEAVRAIRSALRPATPLIGFAGAQDAEVQLRCVSLECGPS